MSKTKLSKYRWVVLAASVAIMFTVWGLGNHPIALYSVPVTQQYGFPRSLFAVIFSIINLFTALGNLAFGSAIKRIGIKRVMVMGSVLAVLAYLLFYLATALPVFYIAAALFGLALAFVTNSPVSVLVNNWFGASKGTALGIVFAASGLGGTICDIFVGRLINSAGFKASFGISAIIITVVLVLAMLLIRPRPASRLEGKADTNEAEIKIEGLTLKQALRTPSFWLMTVTEALWGFSIIPIVATMPSYFSDKGFDPLFVSGVVMASLYAVSAVSKLGLGFVNDKLGSVTMLLIICPAGAIATAMLTMVSSPAWAVASAVCMGIAFSCMTIPVPLLTSSIFGNREYGTLIGIFSAVLTLAGAIGAPVTNMVFDLAGTYLPVFWVQAVFFALSAVTAILAIKLKPKIA